MLSFYKYFLCQLWFISQLIYDWKANQTAQVTIRVKKVQFTVEQARKGPEVQ